jgi:hypothetical protein
MGPFLPVRETANDLVWAHFFRPETLPIASNGVTVARIGATERAIERKQVEVSCEYRLSHGYDIISLGNSGTILRYIYLMSL